MARHPSRDRAAGEPAWVPRLLLIGLFVTGVAAGNHASGEETTTMPLPGEQAEATASARPQAGDRADRSGRPADQPQAGDRADRSGRPAGQPRAAESTHTVAAGETLTAIAAAHGYDRPGDWRLVFAFNSQLSSPHTLRPGQKIVIPQPQRMALLRQVKPLALLPAVDPGDRHTVPEAVWDALALCEASGEWSADTGNGYYGGLQFSLDSWRLVGGAGYPHQASRDEQIARAGLLLERQGWPAWPVCSRVLGLR